MFDQLAPMNISYSIDSPDEYEIKYVINNYNVTLIYLAPEDILYYIVWYCVVLYCVVLYNLDIKISVHTILYTIL